MTQQNLLLCVIAPHSQNHRQHRHKTAAVRKLYGTILDPAHDQPAPTMTTSKAAHRRVQFTVKLRLFCSETCYCVRQHHTPKTIVSTSMTEQQFYSYMAPFWSPHTISRRQS